MEHDIAWFKEHGMMPVQPELVVHLSIPRKPPSQNDFTRRFRTQRLGYITIKREWARWFAPANYKQRAFKGRPESFRAVTFRRLLGPGERKYDDDNLRGGLKPVRDILIETGWIVDDDASHAVFFYYQERSPIGGGPALVIRVYSGLYENRTTPLELQNLL